jgi:hypothetical protein
MLYAIGVKKLVAGISSIMSLTNLTINLAYN